MDGAGAVVASYGDAKRHTFVRSTLKPLQAIRLVETGAAAAFGLSNAEIALACASHNGEPVHVEAVLAWLDRLGLSEDALECGAQVPYGLPKADARPAANNCSGKHAGMLTLALHLKAPVAGYTQQDHLVQQAILSAVAEMCGAEITAGTCGIDGCSAPNPAMPLENLARGFARFMRPDDCGLQRGMACRHIYQSVIEHPFLLAGTKRLDTVLVEAAGGDILAKIGAEGTYIAVIPAKDRVIALKCEDGAGRAGQAALYALLAEHGLAAAAVLDAIRPVAMPVIRNWRGIETGETRYKL